MLLRGADDGDPPSVRPGEAAQLAEKIVDLPAVADRVAAHQRGAVHDAVGEEGSSPRGEEVALVAAQGEEGKAVAAVRLDERPRGPSLPHGLRDGVAEGPEPEVEGGDAEGDDD